MALLVAALAAVCSAQGGTGVTAAKKTAPATAGQTAATAPAIMPNTADHAETMAALTANTNELKKVGDGVESLPEVVEITGAVVLIVLWSCCCFIIFLMLTKLPGRTKMPLPAPGAAELVALRNRVDEQLGELRTLRAELKAGLAAVQEVVRTSAPAAVVPAVVTLEEAPRAFAAAATDSSHGGSDTVVAVREPDTPLVAAVAREKFEDWYRRMALDGSVEGIDPKPITVNFKNPQALDKNPERFEPLVKNNDGSLMLFVYEGLPKGQYYAAPLLDFKLQFTQTHSRTWQSLFSFKSMKSPRLVRAAVVRAEGNEWTLVKKGEFA